MEISFVFFLAEELTGLKQVFKDLESQFNEYSKKLDYGGGIGKLYIGIVCVKEEFKQFYKIKKPKYFEEGGLQYIEFDVEFDYQIFKGIELEEALRLGIEVICSPKDNFAKFCSKTNFNLMKFCNDLRDLPPTGIKSIENLTTKSCPQNNMPTKPNISFDPIELLKNFLVKEKFEKVEGLYYPSFLDENQKIMLTDFINDSAKELICLIEENNLKNHFHYFLTERLRELDDTINISSDEKDRVLLYFEEMMDIINVSSSNGILNIWRYGFNPNV